MKPIQLIIIGLFVFTGILSALLYQQKSNRLETQIEKKNFGWNPISIKKIIVLKTGQDTVVFSKKDGVWKNDKQFDGMGVAPQIINYFSTMQIKSTSENMNLAMENAIKLQTFDKSGNAINEITIGNETKAGECVAVIDSKPPFVLITNTHNSLSLRKLVEESVY